MTRLQKISTPLLALAGALLCGPPIPAQTPPEADRKAGFEETLREREAQKAEREAARALADRLLEERETQSQRRFDPVWRAAVLHRLSSQPLAELEEAQVTGILPGLVAPALGDSSEDLIYTPVAPCRIIDTRLIPDPIDPGETEQFYAAGAGFASQGGDPNGCGIPFGPATAVMINFVAIGAAAKGNLKVWPWAVPPPPAPTASLLNYGPGLNLANAVAAPICDPQLPGGCAFDIFVQANFAQIHLVADVVGYFHRFPIEEAKSFVESQWTAATTAIGTSCTNYSGGEVTLDAPVAGRVMARANAWLLLDHASGTAEYLQFFIGTSPTDCGCPLGYSTAHTIPAEWPSASAVWATIPVSCQFDVGAGSHTFYLNGISSSGSATPDYFWFASIDATFHPN